MPTDKEIVDDALANLPEDYIIHSGFQYHKIDPTALNLGFLEIKWYSLAYLFGILIGWWYIRWINKKYNNNLVSEKSLDSLPLWMIISIIIGGRLGYVLFYNLNYYLDNISEILAVWQGGMSFHGGLIGVIAGLFIFSKVHKVPYLNITDLVGAAAAIGLFLGRIANFINDELRGMPAPDTLPWSIHYRYEAFVRHPSQIYEALSEGLLLFTILFIIITSFKGLQRRGLVSALFLMLYALFRAFCEHFRAPDYQVGFLYGSWFTMGMALCIPVFITGFIVLICSRISLTK